jgi:hypothetical protein
VRFADCLAVQADSPDLPPLAERRPSPRGRALLSGRIVYAEGRFSLPCTIRNISATGVRVAFTRGTTLPASFWLINVRDQVIYRVRMAWASDAEAGLKIEEAFSVDAIPPGLPYLNRFVT